MDTARLLKTLSTAILTQVSTTTAMTYNMTTDITKYFDKDGLSLNKKVQLEMNQPFHNCAADPADHAYIQKTLLKLAYEGDDESCDYTYLTVTWEITNPEAEDESEVCDWSEFTVETDTGRLDCEKLLTK